MAEEPTPQALGQPAAPAAAEKPAPPPAAKPSLFGAPKKPAVGATQIADLTADLNNASTRLRILEERYENLRKKIIVIEQNMLQNNKKLMTEIRASDEQVKDFSHIIEQMKEEMKLIVRELKLTAKSDEMQQLKKYISVWEPLNFVTRNEAKKIVADAVDEKMQGLISELSQKGFFEEEIRKSMKKAMIGKKLK